VLLTGADQVGTAHGTQGFPQDRPIFGIVITQESFVQPTLAAAADDGYLF
jgi:hypothetical protein